MQVKDFEASVASVLSAVPDGACLLAAVSGGADSTALLLALCALRKQRTFSIHCVYVDHGLRSKKERYADFKHVSNLCTLQSVVLHAHRIPRGKIVEYARAHHCGIEAAARVYRHAIFKKVLDVATASNILIGHTLDDRLETILMRVFRGASPAGLHPMPPIHGKIIRPLIHLRRDDVLAYLSARKSSWQEDSSNCDIQFFRNRVRHKIIPILDAQLDFWRSSLSSFSNQQALISDFLEHEAHMRLPATFINTAACEWNKNDFFSANVLLRERAVFQALNRLQKDNHTHSVPRRKALVSFLEGRLETYDMGEYILRKATDNIVLEYKLQQSESWGFSCCLQADGSYSCGTIHINLSSMKRPMISSFPIEPGPVYIRSIDSFDRFQIANTNKRCKKLVLEAGCSSVYHAFMVEDVLGIVLLCFIEANELHIVKQRKRISTDSQRFIFLEVRNRK